MDTHYPRSTTNTTQTSINPEIFEQEQNQQPQQNAEFAEQQRLQRHMRKSQQTDDGPAKPAKSSSATFTQLLRYLGCGAVVLSAVVFLLQGFSDIDTTLRNWAYLGLMVILSGVGITLKSALQDGKSARLLLGLAVAVIPIQFAQLGGMIHSLVSAGTTDALNSQMPSAVTSLFNFADLSWFMVATTAGISVLLALCTSWFGFKVLARPHAKALSVFNILLCSVLLIPARDGVLAFLVLASLSIATLFADAKFRQLKTMKTREAIAARWMLWLPAGIAICRSTFYLSDGIGIAFMLALVSALLLHRAYQLKIADQGREILTALATLGGSIAWLICSSSIAESATALIGISIAAIDVALLVGLYLLANSIISSSAAIYRLLGSILFAASPVVLMGSYEGIGSATLALFMALSLLGIGLWQKWRMPSFVGSFVTLIAAINMIRFALGDIEVGTWMGLALVGISLVVTASIIERFGRSFVSRAQRSYMHVRAWD